MESRGSLPKLDFFDIGRFIGYVNMKLSQKTDLEAARDEAAYDEIKEEFKIVFGEEEKRSLERDFGPRRDVFGRGDYFDSKKWRKLLWKLRGNNLLVLGHSPLELTLGDDSENGRLGFFNTYRTIQVGKVDIRVNLLSSPFSTNDLEDSDFSETNTFVFYKDLTSNGNIVIPKGRIIAHVKTNGEYGVPKFDFSYETSPPKRFSPSEFKTLIPPEVFLKKSVRLP